MMKSHYKLALCILTLIGFTSCLSEGDETFALQKGDFEELVKATWIVTDCKLYDPQTSVYHSDLFNDTQLKTIYVLGDEEISSVMDSEGHYTSLSWTADEFDRHLTLNGTNYTIESLGCEVMVLHRYVTVNDERFLQKYYLQNMGPAGSIHNNQVSDDDQTYVVSTEQSGTFHRFGYGFTIPKGAVPLGDNGQIGNVAFSVTSVPIAELPGRAPTGVQFVDNSGILANPTNFTFSSPLIIDVPLNGANPLSTLLYHWNAISNRWETVPYSSINGTISASASIIELGYFVLGTSTNIQNFGGIKIKINDLDSSYYYYLTLSSESTGSTSIAFASTNKDLYMANIPLGTYTAMLTRERRSSLHDGVFQTQTSTATVTVNVRTRLTGSGSSFSSYLGWTEINISNISWHNGRPAYWGAETVTYGTGYFQATLNWVNYSTSTTDYDLHLTTPSGTEVYYGNKQGDGFELDRDMISNIGNCVENIYNISETIPKGTYKVRVHHYSGATGRSYTCRVILAGRVAKTFSGITNSDYQDIYTFTIQ